MLEIIRRGSMNFALITRNERNDRAIERIDKVLVGHFDETGVGQTRELSTTLVSGLIGSGFAY